MSGGIIRLKKMSPTRPNIPRMRSMGMFRWRIVQTAKLKNSRRPQNRINRPARADRKYSCCTDAR